MESAMDVDEMKSLDLTNLDIEIIPDYVLESKLQHIKLSEGNNIKVSERYKLIDTVETLETIDNQDLSNIRNGIQNLNLIFHRRLQEMFLTKAASEIYCEESNESVRIKKMIELAKRTITAGPEALKDFKDYKLEKLIQEKYEVFVSDALELKLENETKENEAPLSTLTSRKKRGTSNTNSTSSSSKSTRKFLKISSSSSSTPIKQRARKASDRFQLCHLLQTHSKNNDPKDLKTKVWMCAFEPDVNNPGKTTSLVATCGGDSVCFIDCTTGKVLKKYKQIDEEFYCLCWTVLIYRDEIRNEEKKVSILAVAGVTGDIKLIEPHQLVCFEHVSYHKKPVDSLQFHPIVQHWLFSGAEDRTIVLWDLGFPFSTDNRKAKRLLVLKAGMYGTVRQIVTIPHGKSILAACDDGLYGWDIDNVSENENARSHKYRFQPPGKLSPALDSANCVGNNLIVVKRVQEGTIQLVYSASDFTEDDLYVVHAFNWRKTDTPFLKFNFSTSAETLLAGDDQGTIWMYNMHDFMKKRKSFPQPVEIPTTKCDEKLRCENKYAKLFNHVTCSSSLKHVVAVSDCNVVAIWNM